MCLFYLDFMMECSKKNITFTKLSYRDVVFSRGIFIYENLINLQIGKIPFGLIEQFVEKFVSLMLLMRENKYDRAFWLVGSDWDDMSIKDVCGYLIRETISEYKSLLEKISLLYMKGDLVEVFAELSSYIESISLKSRDVYQWDSYQNSAYENINKPDKWSDKQKLVIEMIKSTNAKSMIDLAGNMGWYCVAVKEEMDYAIVADIDYNCIDFAYEYIRKHEVKNVYPIHINMIAPPLDTYKNLPIGSTGIEPWTTNAISRYQSEVAVALAIVHHLVFSQQLSFDEVVNQLALYTNRWLIVEFINRNDKFVIDALTLNAQFDWYREENFLISLKKRFKIVDSGETSETRTVYLCEVK